MSQFDILHETKTNGDNYDQSNADVIARLKKWDGLYGLTIHGAEIDAVEFSLDKLPEDMKAFANEIYGFCPDTVEQGFGAMLEYADEIDLSADPDMAALLDGIDLGGDDAGIRIMQRSIELNRRIRLWWD